MTVSRQGWAYEIVDGGERVDGLVLYEVQFWASLKRQQDGLGLHVIDGVRCDLVNTFKMQIRTNHQRIVTLPGDAQELDGYLRHVSGLAIPRRLDAEELATSLTAKGLPLSGYEPFMFPSYEGVLEPLSGMWQHEQYTLPLLGQAEANIENYIDVAIREGWEGDKRGTTINLQVGAGTDDAHERDDGTGFNVADVDIRSNSSSSGSSRYNFGIRFTSVTVGQGNTIDAATYQGYTPYTTNDDPNTDIFANNVDDSADFTDEADVTSRALTAASVQWTATDLGIGWATSPEINTVIQGVVDRGGWASGNALMVLSFGKEDTARNYRIRSYEGDSAEAAKLDITYTAVGVTTRRYSLTTMGVG